MNKCTGYCQWATDHPKGNQVGGYINFGPQGWEETTNSDNKVIGYILEKGGENDPVPIATDMETSVMSIVNMNRTQFNLNKLSIVFQPFYNVHKPFDCTILSFNQTIVTCQSEYTVGRYNITFNDGLTSFTYQSYHPNLPYVSSVIPSYSAQGRLTINGKNFGPDITYINNVYYSSQSIKCIPLTAFLKDRSFSCELASSVFKNETTGNTTTRTQLITISVGQVPLTISRFPTYSKESNTMIMFTSNTDEYIYTYLSEHRSGYILAPTTQSDIIMIRNLFYFQLIYPSYHDQSAYYFINGPYPSQPFLTVTGGINHTYIQGINNYDISVINNINDLNAYLTLDTNSMTFINDTPIIGTESYYAVKFELGTQPPSFFNPNQSYYAPTQGGWIVIEVSNLQLPNSVYTLRVQGLPPITQLIPFTDNSSIGFTAPSGVGKGYPITVSVDGRSTADTSVYLSYYGPSITLIQPFFVNQSGGLITLFGQNFGNNQSSITYSIDGVINLSNSITILKPHEQLIIMVPPGTNPSLDIILTVGGQATESYSYPRLIVEYASSVEKGVGGIVTVFGHHFYNVSQITIGGVMCLGPVLINSSQVTCSFDGSASSDGSNPLPVRVTAMGIYSESYSFLYLNRSSCGMPLCSGHGQCVDGSCQCNTGYGGSTCLTPSTPSNNTPSVDPNNGTIGDFSVFFTHIRELDSLGNQISIYPTSLIKWNITTNTSTLRMATGRLNSTSTDMSNFVINVKSIIFLEDTSYWFAGQQMLMSKNSFKYQVDLAGWPFQGRANYLQLVYQLQSPNTKDDDDCSSDQSTNTYNDKNNLLWVQIELGNKLFLTKFSDRVYVDRRVLASNTIILPYDPALAHGKDTKFNTPYSNNILVAMVLPFFEQATIDPTFSLLINQHVSSGQCGTKSLWWIALIVLGIFLIVGIGGGMYFVLKRKRAFERKQRLSFQMMEQQMQQH
ncbi:hypothetical protein SAMD00019534_071820 [Acytostelium subglobosum LB1]|uniref:hypothetical protein n=1 Tax=Acytostelium subglobosum LB1 TaxID=1410327 RepID=UPI000644F516|nr:hypothetical protein SAMD00019534_071820 [Acytostelium subglobosum LB1]GAM24007.1 hypothetical protein SAMD00019534_071820 [Acytostelium subglobosum LB1]|eukprot:XP_012753043.1 hypothetical protein SAMD00019534_071820 [Acytostelium subglobosum LB1]